MAPLQFRSHWGREKFRSGDWCLGNWTWFINLQVLFNLLLFGPKAQTWIIKQLCVSFTQQDLGPTGCFLLSLLRKPIPPGKADWKHSRINCVSPSLCSICPLSSSGGSSTSIPPSFPFWAEFSTWPLDQCLPVFSQMSLHSSPALPLSFQYFTSLPHTDSLCTSKNIAVLFHQKTLHSLHSWCSNSHFPSTNQFLWKEDYLPPVLLLSWVFQSMDTSF